MLRQFACACAAKDCKRKQSFCTRPQLQDTTHVGRIVATGEAADRAAGRGRRLPRFRHNDIATVAYQVDRPKADEVCLTTSLEETR